MRGRIVWTVTISAICELCDESEQGWGGNKTEAIEYLRNKGWSYGRREQVVIANSLNNGFVVHTEYARCPKHKGKRQCV